MKKYNILKIQQNPQLIPKAADWFSQKWGVPKEAYIESMQDCVQNVDNIPQWYLILENDMIIAGVGVIENDFHNRKDLTPNLCALYVEAPYRKQGIAGQLLHFVVDEFNVKGTSTLYLITDHKAFYEKYGWKFLCMVQGDGEEEMSRMYIRK